MLCYSSEADPVENSKVTASVMSLDKPDTTYLCQRCGNCCRWPGDVVVTATEIQAIAAQLDLTESEFIQRFTRLSANRQHLSLVEREDGGCVFLEGQNTCLIQPAKPDQCRGFPNRWRFDGWRELCEAVEVTTS